MSYYYFAASLPTLQLDGELPLSYNDFKVLCIAHLSAGHAAQLLALDHAETSAAAHRFVRSWHQQEAQIRNEVARLRAERKDLDPADHIRQAIPYDGPTQRAVALAFETADPLHRERALDAFRWQQLSERAGYDMFSLESILAYGLKLRIVERWSDMDEDDGRIRARDLIEQRAKDSVGRTPKRTSKTERL